MTDARSLALRTLALTEEIRLATRDDMPTWRAAWRARERWFTRWERWGRALYLDLQSRVEINHAVLVAHRAWGQSNKRFVLRRETPRGDTPDPQAVADLFGIADSHGWLNGALTSYLQLALDTGQDSGQFTLDALGINRTFAWTHPRNIAQSIYAVHGSKVLAQTYEHHLQELAKIVIDATNPRAPAAMSEVVGLIRDEWSTLANWQAERIARTETANVWETTNYNVMRANGITQFETLNATGPSIGIVSGAVDELCQFYAANSPYPIDDTGALPPYHPNCRCTAIPVLTNEDGSRWLPPQEPYTGGDLDL